MPSETPRIQRGHLRLVPPPPPAPPRWRRPALVAAGVGIAALLVLFVGAYGLVGMRASARARLAREALETLRTIRWAQETFVRGRWLDRDGDGTPEYGTVRELAGLDPLAGGAPLPASLLPRANARVMDGVLEHEGYCFAIHPRGSAGFVAYAWPMLSSQLPVFCIDHADRILAADNERGYVGCGSGGPPPDACLVGSELVHEAGAKGDGARWVPWPEG